MISGSSTGIPLTIGANGLAITAKQYIVYSTGAETHICSDSTCGANWAANTIDLDSTILNSMRQKQKFKLTYTDVDGPQTEYFWVNKPLSINAANAASLMPRFTTSNICSTPAVTYSVSAASGTTLNHASVFLSFFDGTSTYSAMNGDSGIDGASDTFQPFGGSPTFSGTLTNAFFYLKSEDEHDRRFVRLIDCY